MTSKRLFISALLVACGAMAAWIWLGRDGVRPKLPLQAAPAGSQAASIPPKSAIPTGRAVPLVSLVAPGSPLVRTDSAPPSPIAEESTAIVAPRPETQPEARSDLENVRFMLRDFRTRMNENPVGSNAEIMRAVMGGNLAGATLGPPAGQTLNSEGELVDRWGTPYFFHQLSKTSMEIRSAGPDRQMWTADDLVTK